jgi:transposase-like protein
VPKPRTETTEVVPTAEKQRRTRRSFTAQEKERILAEADACTERGQLGELLRREGLYSSHLTQWRSQREAQGRLGLEPKKRGPKAQAAASKLLAQKDRRIAALEKELRISKALIELQIKAHEILGVALPRIEDNTEDDSQSSSNSAPKRSR